MDSWSQDQLRKMQCGGNAKLNAFLKQYGIEKATDIKDKYNSKAAEVRGRGWSGAGSPSEPGPGCTTLPACMLA